MKGAAARDISYASSVKTRGARWLVRNIENVTGRAGLIRKAEGYDREVANGADFWEVMRERYNIRFDFPGAGLDNIPRDKGLILIANHPYGILDGLTLGWILSQTRGDFKILAHRVFRKTEDLDKVILPIDFDGTKEAVKLNIQTRKVAQDYLRNGGALGIFPGGTVSTSKKPFTGMPMDPAWRTFTAKLIARAGAAVVPVYFDGHNSRRFQIASHLHYTLRMALLINEFKSRTRETCRAVIGKPLPQAELEARRNDPHAMMDYLRAETYRLSPDPIEDLSYGFEFEDIGRRRERIEH